MGKKVHEVPQSRIQGSDFCVSQKLQSNLEAKIADFHMEVKEVRLEHEFAHELIGNMDETPMFFDMVPGRTIATKGVKRCG